MRWLFVKVCETEEQIVYRYARESDDPDGEIVFYKESEEWFVTRPCQNDADSKWCVERAESKFYLVVEDGFPNRRWVIIG